MAVPCSTAFCSCTRALCPCSQNRASECATVPSRTRTLPQDAVHAHAPGPPAAPWRYSGGLRCGQCQPGGPGAGEGGAQGVEEQTEVEGVPAVQLRGLVRWWAVGAPALVGGAAAVFQRLLKLCATNCWGRCLSNCCATAECKVLHIPSAAGLDAAGCDPGAQELRGQAAEAAAARPAGGESFGGGIE